MEPKARVVIGALLALLASHAAAEDFEVVLLAPKTLYTGGSAAVTVTVVGPAQTAAALPVDVQLEVGEEVIQLFAGTTDDTGRLVAPFETPDIPPGSYALTTYVEGAKETLTAAVQVKQMPVVLIETDKPIYKPGQTIQGRVLILNNELKPTTSDVTVNITDGKGVKIFRKDLETNAFGIAPFTLDLAHELNYGTWKIVAESGHGRGNLDLRVERYVLPRFEVDLQTERDYFRADEKVPGAVTATYFFGKPVEGQVVIQASRYVGVWEEYARYTAPLDEGHAEFLLPEVKYVTGTTGAGGSGSVQLDITVTDASGHEEKTTKLLKIVTSGIEHQLIAAARSFTPSQTYDLLMVAQSPDGIPLSVQGELTCEYYADNGSVVSKERQAVAFEGADTVTLTAPRDAAWAQITSSVRTDTESGQAELYVYAAHSPTDSFLHLSRASNDPVRVGDAIVLDVFRTHDATIYYDVFANGRTVWSQVATGPSIRFQATHQMVPAARVVAYIINPNNEISADTVEFDVVMDAAPNLDVTFSAEEVLPGDPVQVHIDAPEQAMVGLAIVDESVYALNEGRLNMQAVFSELEQRFMDPQIEVHDEPYSYGARDVFEDAGLQVVTSRGLDVPEGRDIESLWWLLDGVIRRRGGAPEDKNDDAALAEPTRVRQFFPETWLWTPDLLTEPNGLATIELTAPDSITTWRLNAVSTSQAGLGMTESSMRVFQEFFGEPDLPYAVTRGEQFPVRVQIFNYLDEPQVVHVELTDADWFDLLDLPEQQVQVNANSVASASFLIQPTRLGPNPFEVTLRSTRRADAVRKDVLVEPEGSQRELIANGVLRAGEKIILDAGMPPYAVPDSQKLLLGLTPSLVAQSINGVDDLLGMPYGCGEQNMIFLAPDVEILRYLDATGQLVPEVRAKAEHFITVGYQRELTFRHADGAFSAFGDQGGKPGSLWLTAFVLDTFSGAREVTTIDETILAEAAQWIVSHQGADGSWEPVGFVCHSEMLGGLEGTYALSAFVTIALTDYGMAEPHVLGGATQFLRDKIPSVQDDPYALAIAALAFARAGDPTADTALDRLLQIATTDADGIHWEPHAVETTAYAALAMIEREKPQANEAIKWLALQRNSLGGCGSTQDTVMALKALMMAARSQSRNVDLNVVATNPGGDTLAAFVVNSENFDVLQTAELPLQSGLELTATGSGDVRYQLVRRFNVLVSDEGIHNEMALEVDYDADHVEVDDIVNVTVTVRYAGLKDATGMMIVDVGVPTGFTTVAESLEALLAEEIITRFEVAGRKVILYLDGLTQGQEITFAFQIKARFPVRAIVPDSQAYAYYEPDVRAEAQGKEIAVGDLPQQ